MKIAVIGAGIVGITSAYELALDGHEVHVYERNAAIAEEASFATAGLLAPSLLHPLSHRPWPGTALRHRIGYRAVSLTRNASLRELGWWLGWRRPSGAEQFMATFNQLQGLVGYGLLCQQSVCRDAGIALEQTQGQLALLGSENAMQTLQPKLDALKAAGVPFKVLSAAEARMVEPGIDEAFPLYGAVHFTQDEVANCRQFAHLLRDRATALGVEFQFNAQVTGLDQKGQADGKVAVMVAGTPDAARFDRVVLCSGTSVASNGSGGQSGLTGLSALTSGSLPLTSVQSYSVSVPVRESFSAPRSAVLDYASGISVARMGNRIRVCGGAELGQRQGLVQQKSTRALFRTLQTCFPGAASFRTGGQICKGSSSFTPDGLPLVGTCANNAIWLNLGHGYNGWGLACGTARILADLIAGKAPAKDATALSPARFAL